METQPLATLGAAGVRQQADAGRGRAAIARVANVATAERRADGLGWFSIALGLAELLAPRAVAQLAGVRDGARTDLVLRACGAREIMAGVGIFTQKSPSLWLWARVAGDVVDLALLGNAYTKKHANKGRIAASMAAVAGVTALDIVTARELSKPSTPTPRRALKQQRKEHKMRVVKTITVNKGAEEVSALWSRLEGLPQDRVIVRFTSIRDGKQTEIRVELLDARSGGLVASAISKLLRRTGPADFVRALRQFKQVCELGEITLSDASIHKGMHAAQPAAPGDRTVEEHIVQSNLIEKNVVTP